MIVGLLALLALPSAPLPSCQPGHRPVPPTTIPAPPGAARGAFSLRTLADIRLPGAPVRFDYVSLDPINDRLYIAHMDAGELVVISVHDRRVVAAMDGFPKVHGVLALPELGRVYASSTGKSQVTVVDMKTLTPTARVSGIDYPDGIAYAPNVRRLFVSDEHGRADAVIDIFADTLITRIPLGGEAGNTVYDPVSACILVAVHDSGDVAVIDPESNQVVARIKLPDIERPHGIGLDVGRRLAFIAGEGNSRMAVLDLSTGLVTGTYPVGEQPDVLAVDEEWGRVYVGSESGTVSTFTEMRAGSRIVLLHDGDFYLPHAHSIAVDPRTHVLYLPLEDMGGHPVLRIMTASAPQ